MSSLLPPKELRQKHVWDLKCIWHGFLSFYFFNMSKICIRKIVKNHAKPITIFRLQNKPTLRTVSSLFFARKFVSEVGCVSIRAAKPRATFCVGALLRGQIDKYDVDWFTTKMAPNKKTDCLCRNSPTIFRIFIYFVIRYNYLLDMPVNLYHICLILYSF